MAVVLPSLVPSQPPVHLKTLSRISPTKLNITWEPVPTEFMHGTLKNYIVRYQKVKAGDENKEEEEVKSHKVDANTTHFVLTDLDPYVEYQVSVAATTAKGKGPFAYATGGMKNTRKSVCS